MIFYALPLIIISKQCLHVKHLILNVQFQGADCLQIAHYALSNVVISNQLTRKTGVGEGGKSFELMIHHRSS